MEHVLGGADPQSHDGALRNGTKETPGSANALATEDVRALLARIGLEAYADALDEEG